MLAPTALGGHRDTPDQRLGAKERRSARNDWLVYEDGMEPTYDGVVNNKATWVAYMSEMGFRPVYCVPIWVNELDCEFVRS